MAWEEGREVSEEPLHAGASKPWNPIMRRPTASRPARQLLALFTGTMSPPRFIRGDVLAGTDRPRFSSPPWAVRWAAPCLRGSRSPCPGHVGLLHNTPPADGRRGADREGDGCCHGSLGAGASLPQSMRRCLRKRWPWNFTDAATVTRIPVPVWRHELRESQGTQAVGAHIWPIRCMEGRHGSCRRSDPRNLPARRSPYRQLRCADFLFFTMVTRGLSGSGLPESLAEISVGHDAPGYTPTTSVFMRTVVSNP